MVKIKGFLISLILLGLVAVAAIVAGSQWLLHQPVKSLQRPILFEVEPGSHARIILKRLNHQQLVGDLSLTYLASRLWQVGGQLKAGVYQLEPGLTLEQLWTKLEHGDQYQFQVTLVEGQTLAQWLQRLHQQPYLQSVTRDLSEQALLAEVTGSASFSSLEGLLAPDTYSYQAYSTDLLLLRQAYQEQQQLLNQFWRERAEDLPYKSPYEMLIMASIIEKETGYAGERPLVSSVFVNRLRLGMRLQSDPTTIYGIANFDGNLTRAHLREATPYNTYKISGLPPTPIAMPGTASLRAAAHPATSDYLYFVADGSGGHVFSKTLAEHNKAVNRYQRKQTNP
ncbi:endolytic transglycosylase MltG [Pseudidiomarina sp.]|uniref:endolytic transglycosylase MltG n=1 Tax=Pseudidiomarina sp. TaxID=2081707 RepID=UPI00299D2C7B|nr:endolytic transglycosylase MltG [Pseudidiomarina sp.]MDX1704952.1 endolytic transglycosylase MltG [Pseudidiomarina sp.]